MAGGILGFKKDPKDKKSNQLFSNEILKDGSISPPKTENKGIFGLNGILRPGQSVEFNKPKQAWSNEFLPYNGNLETQAKLVHQQEQQELKKEIEDLLVDIKKLIKNTEQLKDTALDAATNQPVTEINKYQVNFLQRIKSLILQARINVSQAANCLEMFQGRKKKKNAFWNNVKNKKRGGEQYLMSNEHSAARSAV